MTQTRTSHAPASVPAACTVRQTRSPSFLSRSTVHV